MKKKSINVVSTTFMALLILAQLFPFYIMLIGSFKNNSALIKLPPDLNPFKNILLANVKYVIEKTDIAIWLANSFKTAFGVAFLTVFVAATAGYAFARIKFRGRGIFFMLVIGTMILPKQILLIPNYLVAMNLGLKNTLIGVVLTSVSPSFAVFLCRQFMLSIPAELTEAAEIDGCGETRKFMQIIIPMSLPALGAVGLFSFFTAFNDYLWQLIMISSKHLQTLPIGVAMFSQKNVSNVGYQFVAAAIATMPIVLIFLIFQKAFIKGITFGGIKG